MKTNTQALVAALVLAFLPGAFSAPAELLPSLTTSAKTASAGFESIPPERQRELKKVALFIKSKVAAKETAKVTFICTHNSRRSHFAQIWAQTAAAFYGVKGFQAFSGGTEATACNPRTVAALKRAGFEVSEPQGEKNPVYLVKYVSTAEPIRSYSKIYSTSENPQSNFLAAMTCDQADGNCPVVEGAAMRVPLHYTDPKVADGKPEESSVYDERSQQIAREMFFLMSLVKPS